MISSLIGPPYASRATQRHRSCSSRLCIKPLLLILVVCVIPCLALAQSSVVRVSQLGGAGSSTLLGALQDDSISHIIVDQPLYNARSEFAPYQGKPISIDRNVTISGGQQDTILDLDFVASAVQLCSSCSVTFVNITVANERRGTGEAVDFFVGGSGRRAVVQFINSNKLRLACTVAADAAAVLTDTPPPESVTGAAVSGQVASVQDATFKGVSYPDSLLLSDVVLEIPFETVEGWRGGTGGYVMVAKNTTRLCRSIIDSSCLQVSTPEACVTGKLDELRAAQGQGGSNNNTTAIAVGASIGGAALIALIVGGLFCIRRSRRGGEQEDGLAELVKRNDSLLYGPGRYSSVTSRKGAGDVEAVDVEALRMFDSFIEGCNFIRAPLGVRKGWEVSKVMTSPFANEMAMEERADIQLGQFLGAGSFGRVYRAQWGGKNVAVKVIEHNSDASSAVESEVELMFKFSNHRNIVRAFYAITYTQNSTPTCGLNNGSSSSNTLGKDTGHYMLNSSNSSNSNSNKLGIASGGSSQRAALASYRNIPLKEAASEDGVDHDDRTAEAADQGSHDQATSSAAVAAGSSSSSSLAARRFVTTSKQPSLERIASDPTADAQQQQQQPQQQSVSSTPTAKLPSAYSRSPGIYTPDKVQQALRHEAPRLYSSEISDAAQQGLGPPAVTGSRVQGSSGITSSRGYGSTQAVQGSPLGPRDNMQYSPYDRVYSWMGSSSSGSGLQQSQPSGQGFMHPGPGFAGLQGLGEVRKPGEVVEVGRDKRAETWLVQEFCDLGTLGGVVADWKLADESDGRMLQRLLLLRDAAQGLKLLHSLQTVHGDLTARNVLVCSDPQAPYGMVAKLADLGLSRVIKLHRTHRTTNTVGTLSHMPPELLRQGHCSTAVDIYAFGVMMWELYTNKAAFSRLQYGQFYETVVIRNLRPLLPAGMPADYSLLMQHCWASDPLQRPNVDRVLHCLGLMISERQQRLSELDDTAAARIRSAPLPTFPDRLTEDPSTVPQGAALSFSAAKQMFSAAPDGCVRHRSCPGPGGTRMLPPYELRAAVLAAHTAAMGQDGDEPDEEPTVDLNKSLGFKPVSWGDRSTLGCSTPAVPVRPPLPWLRRYVSDEYGTDLGPQEERWFV